MEVFLLSERRPFWFAAMSLLILLPVEQGAGSPWAITNYSVSVPYDDPPKEVPTLDLPKGSKNLAAGKPVTSSAMGPPVIGELADVTDGDKKSVAGGFYGGVEIEPGKQYVQIDLQEIAEIHAVWLWYQHPVEAYDVPFDVVVQISKEIDFSSGVSTEFNCDHDDSLGLGKGSDRHFATSRFGKLIRIDGRLGRFVRVYGKGSARTDRNTFLEVEVHGVPAVGKRRRSAEPSAPEATERPGANRSGC